MSKKSGGAIQVLSIAPLCTYWKAKDIVVVVYQNINIILYYIKMVNKKKISPISVIVLAGGKSSRMGLDKDKGHMPFMGIGLLDRVIMNILRVAGVSKHKIIIVGPKEKYAHYGFVVEDIYPGKGPLGGIFSGLKYSKTFYNLVIGYDMPFIEPRLVEYLIAQSIGYDLVLPTYGRNWYEPLCAIYSKDCLEIIEHNLKKGLLAVRDIFPSLKIRWIGEEEIKKFDPDFHSFFNINCPDDFIKAEKWAIEWREKYVQE